MITSLSTHPTVIDLSTIEYTDKHHFSSDPSIQHLLTWLQHHPDRSSVRVYVRSGIIHSQYRKLQTRLMSAGCTVIAKARF